MNNINKIVRDEAIKQQDFIADLNREQLMNGVKGDGTSMPDYVADSKQPSAPGKITLFEEGGFHRGITPDITDTGFTMDSTDPKKDLMIWGYGDAILKLNKESISKLRIRMIPGIRERIKRQ